MVREDDILLLLYNDPWFRPNKSTTQKPLTDKNGRPLLDKDGNQLTVPVSYYRSFKNGTQIVVRISNHGTDLSTWVKHNPDPTKSLQNASIVFANGATTPKLKTKPYAYKDKNGKTVCGYRYFVVEEFAYAIENYNIDGIKKIINAIKKLERYDKNSQPVFKDPFEADPQRRAGVKILTPQDEYHRDIKQDINDVNPRQLQITKKMTEGELMDFIKECVDLALNEIYNKRII